MHIKLINPRNKFAMMFQCASEAYYGPADPKNLADMRLWEAHQASLGNDARRYIIWPEAGDEEKIRVSELILPRPPNSPGPIAILTNWDAWICNDTGRSMDRVHRHRVETE